MQRRWYATPTANIATGTSAKTLIQIVAASSRPVTVDGGGVGFKGVTSSNEPVTVEILRQSTAGTMTSLTLVKADTGQPSLVTTAQHTASSEPTAGDILAAWVIHPQGGRVEWQLPAGMAFHLEPSERLGLRVTAANDVNCRPYLTGTE